MTNDIIITVSGPAKSGKGHVIAAIAHKLQELNCEVVVQGAETHNAKNLAKSDDDIAVRLTGAGVLVIEQQTGSCSVKS